MYKLIDDINSADLHMHSCFSDGIYTPHQLAQKSYDIGLKLISITDHDTINGVSQMKASGDNLSSEAAYIYVLNGIEISTSFSSEAHLLAYGVTNNMYELLDNVKAMQDDRVNRGKKIIKKLNELGINISYEEVCNLALKDNNNNRPESFSRVHIARCLVNKKIVPNISKAFSKYLGAGKSAYFERKLMSLGDTVEIVKKSGAMPVLAHPMLLSLSNNKLKILIRELKGKGLMGIEVYHPSTDDFQQKMLRDIAEKNQLICTSGSDYHDGNHNSDEIGYMQKYWQNFMQRDIEIFMDSLYNLKEAQKPFKYSLS